MSKIKILNKEKRAEKRVKKRDEKRAEDNAKRKNRILIRNNSSKKAQMKMGENIAVLFVFFLIIAFGMIFYMRVLKHTSQTRDIENFELQSIKIAQLVNFLPELQCSSDNIVKDACIDLYKLQAFKDIVNKNQDYYYNLFKFSKIEVDEIYPET